MRGLMSLLQRIVGRVPDEPASLSLRCEHPECPQIDRRLTQRTWISLEEDKRKVEESRARLRVVHKELETLLRRTHT